MRESLGVVRRAAVDGVLADGITDGHPALGVLIARGVPVVRSVDCADGRCVVVDYFGAARAVGEHLAALGHRRVTMLLDSGSNAEAFFPYARLRLEGLRAGLGPGADVMTELAGENTRAAGRVAGTRVLDSAVEPSAIVTVSDVLALGVLDALERRAMRAGFDVSVAGFDDVPAAGDAGLTTVSQPIREKGRLMARMLLDPNLDQRRIVLPTRLIVRASTGPAQPERRSSGHG